MAFPAQADKDDGDQIHAPAREDEAELVARVRVGDVAAFESLYRAYHIPLTVFVAGYVHAPDVAEELVQDVLCHVWERRTTWQPAGSIGSYLYTAARNRALNHIRHRFVIERAEADALVEETAPTMGRVASPDERVRVAVFSDAVAHALRSLPERCRQAFMLRWQQHLSIDEVARRMGVSRKAVERHWTKGLKLLRKRLDKLV